MAYINFKEERYAANIQIANRKKNNEGIVRYILKNKEKLKNYNPCQEYSFKNIEGIEYGKDGVKDEEDFRVVEYKDILCTRFIDCNFKNIKYKNCNFIGCVFENCNFYKGGVVFENCVFVKEGTEKLPSLNNKDNLGCSFYKCGIYAKFLNCDLSMAFFEGCNINNTSFNLTYMKKCIIKDCELDKIEFKDCNLSGFKTLNCYIIDLDFTDEDKTKFDEKTCFDKIIPREKTKQEYEGIYMTYETLSDKFKENNLPDNSSEYYYLGKVCERKSLKKIVPKIGSYCYWISCGYGQRGLFPIFTSALIIIVFTIIYLLMGIKIEDQTIRFSIQYLLNTNLSEILNVINEALTLSVSMFACVGCINARPAPVAYMFVNVEMLLGILMMGVGVATLIKKAKNN